MKHILVASTKASAVEVIRTCAGKEFIVEPASDRSACYDLFLLKRPEVAFIDIGLLKTHIGGFSQEDYKEALQPFWQIQPNAKIVILSAQKDTREALSALKAGAAGFLNYPIATTDVREIIRGAHDAVSAPQIPAYVHDTDWDSDAFAMHRTDSPVMKLVFDKVRMVASTQTTVLLLGETGTGKGIIARLIHDSSRRSDQPFVSVHCGAIPEALIESELFGHERGAFTGAIQRRLGKFGAASGGTIFLDEIGTITAATQVKLLQVLQDHTFQPVGGEKTMTADVRVVTASNIDLEKMCGRGEFRTDLYYRLNVFPIRIPALRERKEDIPLLIDFFIKKFNKLNQKEIEGVSAEMMEGFLCYGWPGNIRELENLIQRAFILEKKSVLTKDAFPQEIFFAKSEQTGTASFEFPRIAEARRIAVEQAEKQYLKSLLTATGGRIASAARTAGISRRQLYKLLVRYGIKKEAFKKGRNRSG